MRTMKDCNDECLKAQKQTINTMLKSLEYQWFMRAYISPHVSANIPGVCSK